MSNNKQSSIEWLRSLYENRPAYEEFILDEEWEQAKAMHKEEHSNTWDESLDNYKKRGENDMRHWVDFDYYYNEIFGGNNDKEQNS